MNKRYPSDNLSRLTVRIPPEMLEELKSTAAENGRSQNSELVIRIRDGARKPDRRAGDKQREDAA